MDVLFGGGAVSFFLEPNGSDDGDGLLNLGGGIPSDDLDGGGRSSNFSYTNYSAIDSLKRSVRDLFSDLSDDSFLNLNRLVRDCLAIPD